MKLALLLIGLTLLAGCQKRPSKVEVDLQRPSKVEVDLLIMPACITEPVRMRNCDRADAQRCKTAIVTWAKGCEKVDARPR